MTFFFAFLLPSLCGGPKILGEGRIPKATVHVQLVFLKFRFLGVATHRASERLRGRKDWIFRTKLNSNPTRLSCTQFHCRGHTGLKAPENDLANSLDITTLDCI